MIPAPPCAGHFFGSSAAEKRKSTILLDGACVSVDLSSRLVSKQVLSAQQSLTSVFGMGTGGPFALKTLTMSVRHDLSSRLVSKQVLSALQSLTSVFGMGTGGPFALEWQTFHRLLPTTLILYHNSFHLSIPFLKFF